MTLRDNALLQAGATPRPPDARRARTAPPKGWEPGVRFDPSAGAGEVVTEPLPAGEEPDWSHLFAHFGLNPNQFEVVPPVEMRSWESWADGDSHWLYYYRAKFQPLTPYVDSGDLSDLIDAIAKDRRVSKLSTGDAALVVCLSDWQTGKRDGDGTRGLIGRVRQAIIDLRGRVRDLKRMGVSVGAIYVVGLGDLVEGCDGNYAMQSFGVELNRRDQRKVARRLAAEVIRAASKLCEQVVVVAVPGNHGEHRRNGKAFTDLADNDDVAVFEEICEAFTENPDAYSHVSFVIPNDELTVTLDIAGTIVTFAHGHQFGGGATAETKAKAWLSKQALGKNAAGDCDLLVTGHYHHLCVAQWGAVAWIQVPALDGGSEWWRNLTGEHSPPGMASLVVGSGVSAAGWGHLHTLGETCAD